MENFEKCTVAMLGGPCMQHITGNASRLNQPQSAITGASSTHFKIPIVVVGVVVDNIDYILHFWIVLILKIRDRPVGWCFPGGVYTQFGSTRRNAHKLRYLSPCFF